MNYENHSRVEDSKITRNYKIFENGYILLKNFFCIFLFTITTNFKINLLLGIGKYYDSNKYVLCVGSTYA